MGEWWGWIGNWRWALVLVWITSWRTLKSGKLFVVGYFVVHLFSLCRLLFSSLWDPKLCYRNAIFGVWPCKTWHSFKMPQFHLVFQQRKTWHHQRADPFDNPCLAWCCMATSSQCSMWTGFSDPRVHVWFASWSWEWKWWSVPKSCN